MSQAGLVLLLILIVILLVIVYCSFIRKSKMSLSAVIVEPRIHEHLDHVIQNAATILGPKVPIHLYHGHSVNVCDNPESVVCTLYKSGQLHTHRLSVDNLDWQTYSQLLSSHQFWDERDTDKTLIFQTDSVFCSASKENIENFMHLDYVGSRALDEWWWLNGGNGGFSLRDTRLSRACSSKAGYLEPEDAHFNKCIAEHGGRMATREEQERFGTQNYFRANSLGAHQINTQLLTTDKEEFQKYCPEYLANMK